MTKEKLEKANAALANLEAHRSLWERISNSGAIAIGPASEVVSQSTQVINSRAGVNSSLFSAYFSNGVIIGLKSDFFANPKIRELCLHFHSEFTRILEEEVAELQSRFENL